MTTHYEKKVADIQAILTNALQELMVLCKDNTIRNCKIITCYFCGAI